MKFLLDTNIVSEVRKHTPNTNVLAFLQNTDVSNLYLSCITIGEIQRGIAHKRKSDVAASISLEKWQEVLIQSYGSNTVNINNAVTRCWGELLAIDGTNAIDALLAAQAVVFEMILVTRNTKHFTSFGVRLINPFE